MSGFAGLSSTSAAPTLSDTNSTLRHVLPPSVVLKTPRSEFAVNAFPIAATQTMFGFVGWMRTAPICPAS